MLFSIIGRVKSAARNHPVPWGENSAEIGEINSKEKEGKGAYKDILDPLCNSNCH